MWGPDFKACLHPYNRRDFCCEMKIYNGEPTLPLRNLQDTAKWEIINWNKHFQKAWSGQLLFIAPARHLFHLRLALTALWGWLKRTQSAPETQLYYFCILSEQGARCESEPAVQVGCTLWPLASVFDCSFGDARLLLYSGTSSSLSNKSNMKQNMARTRLHHASRDIEPFNIWPYPSRSGAIPCDWTPAPILSAAKVNQDSSLIDRIKSWQKNAQPFWIGLPHVNKLGILR
jgi:hypothetical protein